MRLYGRIWHLYYRKLMLTLLLKTSTEQFYDHKPNKIPLFQRSINAETAFFSICTLNVEINSNYPKNSLLSHLCGLFYLPLLGKTNGP